MLDMYSIAPLFNLPIVRFRFTFRVRSKCSVVEIEPHLRSRLGYHLKSRLCLYDNFRTTLCTECIYDGTCGYRLFFSPPDCNAGGRLRNIPRSFVMRIGGTDEDGCLAPGMEGFLDLTMFGDPEGKSRLLRESIREMLDCLAWPLPSAEEKEGRELKMPFQCMGKELVLLPDPQYGFKDCELASAPNRGLYSLATWVECLAGAMDFQSWNGNIVVHLHTPMSLKVNGKVLSDELSFTNLVGGIIRRLRNLKRIYGTDTDMGPSMHSLAHLLNKVQTIESRVAWKRIQRTSYRQNQMINLGGLKGTVEYSGQTAIFLPLLLAGGMVHVGEKTTYGMGSMSVELPTVAQEKRENYEQKESAVGCVRSNAADSYGNDL